MPEQYDDLVRDLALLGRSAEPAASPERIATAVMERIAAPVAPAPVRHRRRFVVAVAAGVAALLLLAVPPVRATIADWFGFSGVLVEESPEPAPESAPPPPEVSSDVSVSEAAGAVDFPVLLPADLGEPDGVEVSDDGRMVSMTWADGPGGVVRVDQFDGRLDFMVVKRSPDVVYAVVAGSDALWFEVPHDVTLFNDDGTRRTESARLAGHTLIWPRGVTTLRLEGDLTLEQAVEIAESAVLVD